MQPTLNPELARFNMIEQQIRTAAPIRDDVRELMHLVRREDFVPHFLRHLAFADTALPLGQAGAAMLPPRIEAAIVQALGVGKRENVLVIGAGSGHVSAQLSVHADHVVGVEIDPALADFARANLRRAGVGNVTIETGNGFDPACGGSGPFDVIVVAGGVRRVPATLADRLKIRGRLFAFVGASPVVQACVMTRAETGGSGTRVLFETDIEALRDVPGEVEFIF